MRHVATCLPDATTLVGLLLPSPNEQMIPQLFGVGPTPSLPLVLMLLAAKPKDVLLEFWGAFSKRTENESDGRRKVAGKGVTEALAMGYDEAEPGRCTAWSSSVKASCCWDTLISYVRNVCALEDKNSEPRIKLGHWISQGFA